MKDVVIMGNIELIAEAAKVDSPAVKELIRRFVDAEGRAELNEIKLNHQVDLVSVLRQTIDVMDGTL